MATNELYGFDEIRFGTLFRLLTEDIACWECVFAEFYLNPKGFGFKCQNTSRMKQGTGFCYSEGRPQLFDESQKSAETGLYHSQCESCGIEIRAPSVLDICQSCYDQLSVEKIADEED